MSFNSSSLPQASANTWIEDYYALKQLEANDAWYNPALETTKSPDGVMIRPQTIYVGTEHNKPTWEIPVFDVKRHVNAWKAFREGRYNADQAEYKAWLQPEFEEAAKVRADVLKYGKAAAREFRSAAGGVITSVDSPAIAVVQLLGEIMGRDEAEYVLEDAVRRVATPNLTLSIDTFKGFNASANVGEGVEAFVKKGEFTREQYFLSKDVAHIMASDESSMTSDRDVFNQHVEHAVHDMRRIKNQKIATELATASNDVTGGDWRAVTGGLSNVDPIRVIGDAADLIAANAGRPNRIVSGGIPYRAFSSNTRVIGSNQAAQDVRFGASVVNNLPGLPNFTWYVDQLVTADSVYVFDQNAVLLMQGPVRTAQYRIEPKGMDGYITRDYNLIKIVDQTRIREITDVTT